MKMDIKVFRSRSFVSVFIAELGDKTQLATMLFASDKEVSKLTVFLGAAAALVVASAIGVLAGAALSKLRERETFEARRGAWGSSPSERGR